MSNLFRGLFFPVLSDVLSPIGKPFSGGAVPWTVNFAAVPDIVRDYAAWEDWADYRKAQFLSHCPSKRGTTYYFSQSGNDSTGDGSEANPYKSISKALGLILASSGNIRCRFKRGDVWIESSGIVTTKNNVTIDDYGTGNKPVFDRFTLRYTTGWTLASGNRYTRTEVSDVAWVKRDADPLGDSTGTPFIRQNSAANVGATSNSFWWDSATNTLHVNLGGTDPNTVALSAVPSNESNGVEFGGDGCRCQNIVGYGWGCHRTITATQDQPFTSRASGDNANVFIGCEGFYSGSHSIAHNVPSSSGGHVMFIDCVAGYSKFNSSAETIFNCYAVDGDSEAWFDGCEVRYGTLPSSDWSYASEGVRGDGVYAHTGGGAAVVALLVVRNCTLSDSISPARRLVGDPQNLPVVVDHDFTTFRAFMVGCTHEATGTPGSGDFCKWSTISNGIMYGCEFDFVPKVTAELALTNIAPSKQWVVNTYVNADLDVLGNNTFGFWNASVSGIDTHIWFSMFRGYNGERTSTDGFGFDFDMRANNSPPPTGTSQGSTCFGSIFTIQKSTGGDQYNFGINNVSSTSVATPGINKNAYFGLKSSTNLGKGFDNDAGKVILVSAPAFGVSQASLLDAGPTFIGISHDFYGNPRSATPDIGPVEFS